MNLKLKDLKIPPEFLGKQMLLVDILPVNKFKNGLRTEEVTAYRYVVALPKFALEKISVRIDGAKLIEKTTDFAEVEFTGLELFIYEIQGEAQIGARATGIKILNNKN